MSSPASKYRVRRKHRSLPLNVRYTDYEQGEAKTQPFDYRQEEAPVTAPNTPMVPQGAFPRQTTRQPRSLLPQNFPDLNLALGLDRDGNGTMSLNGAGGSFPSFHENPSSNGPMQRQAPTPMQGGQQSGNNGVNGGGAMNGMGVGMPVNAGQQMDVNMMYQKLMELSEVLRENRERTQGIVAGAEELAVCMAVFQRRGVPTYG